MPIEEALARMGWFKRTVFLARYEMGMTMSYLRTRWFVWKYGLKR